MKIRVLDLATHLGYADIEDGVIVESGNINLGHYSRKEQFISTQCRKTLPKEIEERTLWEQIEDGRYCKIKTKKVKVELSRKEQLESLEYVVLSNRISNFDKLVVEAPAIPFKAINISSIRKQFALYGIVDYVIGDYIEIEPNKWFSFICEEFPHLVQGKWTERKNKNGTTTQSIVKDRKKTSLTIANEISDKEIEDDNEADAICLAYYVIKHMKEIF